MLLGTYKNDTLEMGWLNINIAVVWFHIAWVYIVFYEFEFLKVWSHRFSVIWYSLIVVSSSPHTARTRPMLLLLMLLLLIMATTATWYTLNQCALSYWSSICTLFNGCVCWLKFSINLAVRACERVKSPSYTLMFKFQMSMSMSVYTE